MKNVVAKTWWKVSKKTFKIEKEKKVRTERETVKTENTQKKTMFKENKLSLTQCEREQCHVTKVEDSLEQSVHLRFEEEVIKWIQINVAGSGGGREKRRPLPPEYDKD